MTDDASRAQHDAVQKLRRQYDALLQRLESNQSEFRRLARATWRLQEDERRRIARELHDGIGQNLTALKHQLAATQALLGDAEPDARARLDASIALCGQTLEDTRNLSRLLRPQILDDLGLEPALRWLVRSFAGTVDLHIELDVAPLPPLDPELQTLVFRLAQEGLSNVVRHSGATQAVLAVAPRPPGLWLTVWDDGGRLATDGDAPASGGIGLAGMRERVESFGGALRVESDPATGTWIRAALPLPETDTEAAR
jgi:two-component system sensor histidine kinase UhpB